MTASSASSKRLEQPAVRIEARRIQNGIFHAEVGGQALLEIAMQALGAADEAHRGDAVAVAGERILRRREHRGMVGETEIVVGAQIDQLAPVGEPHERALRAGR